MAIMRQKTKRILWASLLGGLVGILITLASGYFLQDYWLPFIQKESSDERFSKTIPIPVTDRPMAAGSIIAQEDIRWVDCLENMIGDDQVIDGEALIGEELIVDLSEGMTIGRSFLKSTIPIDQGLRLYECDFIRLPYLIEAGNVIDVRIMYPTGETYTVVSRKNVLGLIRQEGQIEDGYLTLGLKEEEALRLASALIDQLTIEGCNIYLVKYVDAARQDPTLVNYPVNGYVYDLMEKEGYLSGEILLTQLLERRMELEDHLLMVKPQDPWIQSETPLETENILEQNLAKQEATTEHEDLNAESQQEHPLESADQVKDTDNEEVSQGQIGF